MREVLLTIPTPILATFFLGVSIGLTILATLLVRWKVKEDVHSSNTEVAGFMYAGVSVIYAVLLGFVTIMLWQNFADAQAAAANEASGLVNIYRISSELDEPTRTDLRNTITHYAQTVIDEEWDKLALGSDSEKAQQAMDQIWGIYAEMLPSSKTTEAHQNSLFRLLETVNANRQFRIAAGQNEMPLLMWFLLVVGGLVVVGYTLFFRAPDRNAHLLMSALMAGIVSLVLLLIVELDTPFVGGAKIEPTPFQEALLAFERLASK